MDFTETKLYRISNKKYLSELLGIELKKLKEVEKYYTATSFDKEKNGKKRTLYNPPKNYKLVLQKINSFLSQITPPPYILGGIKKRDYAMNAATHQQNQYFMLLDIENFFPSTEGSYVYKFFRYRLAMSEDIAKICTLLTTVPKKENPLQRFLPQGFPTSPILSFLCYFEMYYRINILSQNKNITFSCYYDDFAFSSTLFINKSFKSQVASIVKEYSFSINSKKTRLLKNKKGIKVTGTILKNGKSIAPNKLQKKMIDHFDELNTLYINNPKSTTKILELCNKVQGCISAIQNVEKDKEFSYITSEIRQIRGTIKKSSGRKAKT